MAGKGELTPKQRLFVAAYLGKAACNGTQAARMAGYKGNDVTLKAVASENLTKPLVKAALQQGLEKATAAMEEPEILERLSAHGRGNLDDFLDERGLVDLERARERGQMPQLKEIRQRVVRSSGPDEEGVSEAVEEVQIKLHDPQGALDKLARIRGLYKDTAPGAADLAAALVEALRGTPGGE
jgi:hypothetical protein